MIHYVAKNRKSEVKFAADSILINTHSNRGAHGDSSEILEPVGFLTEKLPLQALAKWREHVTQAAYVLHIK